MNANKSQAFYLNSLGATGLLNVDAMSRARLQSRTTNVIDTEGGSLLSCIYDSKYFKIGKRKW